MQLACRRRRSATNGREHLQQRPPPTTTKENPACRSEGAGGLSTRTLRAFKLVSLCRFEHDAPWVKREVLSESTILPDGVKTKTHSPAEA